MKDSYLKGLVKTALSIHFQRLAKKGGSKRGPTKVRSSEVCRRARRRRTALQAARKRDFSTMGKCGGANARGPKKARPSEVARMAALAGVARRNERAELAARAKGAAFVEKFKTDLRTSEAAFREKWFGKA